MENVWLQHGSFKRSNLVSDLFQVKIHLKQAMLETLAAKVPDNQGSDSKTLGTPNRGELIMLLASVIVQARPSQLLSTLNYADLFAWSVPCDMM